MGSHQDNPYFAAVLQAIQETETKIGAHVSGPFHRRLFIIISHHDVIIIIVVIHTRAMSDDHEYKDKALSCDFSLGNDENEFAVVPPTENDNNNASFTGDSQILDQLLT